MDKGDIKIEKLSVPDKISLSIPDITPYVSARLYFSGGNQEGYRLAEFNIGFHQDIDYKGQPQHDEAGGIMSLTLTHVTDAAIDFWAMKSRELKNGSVIFRQHGTKVLTITFEQAYCINCQQSVSESGGVVTRMIISPNIINLNDIDHNNNWALDK